MGSKYVYKIIFKIKIVKYCKRWPNHIYRTEFLVCQLYKLLTHQKFPSIYVIWPSFTVFYYLNTFTAIVDLSRFNYSCLKSPASTLVDLTFQSRALRSFSLNQLRNLSL